MKIKTIKCNKYNYGSKRKIRKLEAIVIHYTANDGDTAENNGNYFKNNVVGASAHYFIDRKGTVIRSIYTKYTAWAVESRGMKLKGIWNNVNTVSIELCDFKKNKELSPEQMKALKILIKRIQRYVYLHGGKKLDIIRHYDVCGKACPANLVDDIKWQKFKKEVLK